MASSQEAACDIDEDEVPGYKPPAEKSLEEIMATDQEDESLKRYKASLLGNVNTKDLVKDGPNIRIENIAIIVEEQEIAAHEIDTEEKRTKMKDDPLVVPEGSEYKIKVDFKVYYDIVTGLKFVTTIKKKGIQVVKMNHMMGSYGPKSEKQSYKSPIETAPSGMLGRGTYHCVTEFKDDDKTSVLSFPWTLKISKKDK